MAELGIRIEHLRKRYGEGDTAVDALKDVNMTVAPGEVPEARAGPPLSQGELPAAVP